MTQDQANQYISHLLMCAVKIRSNAIETGGSPVTRTKINSFLFGDQPGNIIDFLSEIERSIDQGVNVDPITLFNTIWFIERESKDFFLFFSLRGWNTVTSNSLYPYVGRGAWQ